MRPPWLATTFCALARPTPEPSYSAAECHGAVSLCKVYGVADANQALELLSRVRRMLAGLMRR